MKQGIVIIQFNLIELQHPKQEVIDKFIKKAQEEFKQDFTNARIIKWQED